MNAKIVKAQLQKISKKAPPPKGTFFKTGKGSYAEHDQFLNVPVPTLRKIAADFKSLSLAEIKELLYSPFNEERLLALIILVNQYQKADLNFQEKIYQFYLKHLKQVNNWNLVDSSAHLIIGTHLLENDKKILLALANSSNLWERRIAMVSTWYFIRQNQLDWTFKLAKLLLKDKEDLIHKAVGWMLREAGKKDNKPLLVFLEEHAAYMPRTMLRYAIEKLPELKRKVYLAQ